MQENYHKKRYKSSFMIQGDSNLLPSPYSLWNEANLYIPYPPNHLKFQQSPFHVQTYTEYLSGSQRQR